MLAKGGTGRSLVVWHHRCVLYLGWLKWPILLMCKAYWESITEKRRYAFQCSIPIWSISTASCVIKWDLTKDKVCFSYCTFVFVYTSHQVWCLYLLSVAHIRWQYVLSTCRMEHGAAWYFNVSCSHTKWRSWQIGQMRLMILQVAFYIQRAVVQGHDVMKSMELRQSEVKDDNG